MQGPGLLPRCVMECHVLSCGVPPPAAMCHGMSCFVMWGLGLPPRCVMEGHGLYANGAYAVFLSGMKSSFRAGARRVSSDLASFGMGPFLSQPFRSSSPAAGLPGRRNPLSARIARLIAPARARPGAGSGRGAVSVRLARLRVFGMGSSFRSRFRSSGPAAGLPGRRNPFPRVSRACALAPGRARYATARIARLIAPARARPNAGHTCPLASRWHFFAPARNGRGRDAADAAPFPPTHPSADFPKSTPVPEILQNSRTCSEITYESHQPP